MKRTFQFLLVTVLAAEALVLGQGPDAMKVLADVRTALGGEARLEAVKSVTVEGRLTRSSGGNSQTNDFEMAFELPDKFVKKEVLAVMGTSTITRTTGFNGDGLIELIDTPPAMGGGMMITRMAGSAGVPSGMKATPEQLETQRKALLATNKREFARLSLGMFAANPAAFPLEFSYAGEAEAPDGKAYVIDVKGVDGFAARLFVDTKTRLPLMLSWMDKEPLRMTSGGSAGSASGPGIVSFGHGVQGGRQVTPEEAEKIRQDMEQRVKEAEANRRTVEYRIFYGDYKTIAGVQMPTRIQRMVDSQPVEELSLEKIKVNTKIDPRKFEVTK